MTEPERLTDDQLAIWQRMQARLRDAQAHEHEAARLKAGVRVFIEDMNTAHGLDETKGEGFHADGTIVRAQKRKPASRPRARSNR